MTKDASAAPRPLYVFKRENFRKTVTRRVRIMETDEAGWMTTVTDFDGNVVRQGFTPDEKPA